MGDTLTFGSFEQDNDLYNGAEPIEWMVLAVDGNKALLLSKYVLTYKHYNDLDDLRERFGDGNGGINHDNVKLTWEDSTLRAWLNSYFYDKAFSGTEKKKHHRDFFE